MKRPKAILVAVSEDRDVCILVELDTVDMSPSACCERTCCFNDNLHSGDIATHYNNTQKCQV